MIPAIYVGFFTTMAAVGATLFGLIFVAISIVPENIIATAAPLDRQIRATAAYVALLNPLMVALFALVPDQPLGISVTILSWIGILNTLAMAVTLLQGKEQGYSKVRNYFLILVSLILYGIEAYVATKLYNLSVENHWISLLADLLIILTLFGIVRAWEIIGIRHFRIRDWLAKVIDSRKMNRKSQDKAADEDEAKKE